MSSRLAWVTLPQKKKKKKIPALRQKQVVSEFKDSLVYRGNSRTARATEKPCLKKQNKTK